MTTPDPRDLEWQRRYEENDTPWDKGVAAPPLIHYLKSNAITGRVLVPGCGRGHEVRALAHERDCTVTGLDLAPMAIMAATRVATEAGLSDSTRFIEGDFINLPAEMAGAFDWIVEHTCFCAIAPSLRTDYVRSAATALSPGGTIFGIFFLTPDTEAGPPFAVSMEEITSLFEPHFDIRDLGFPPASFPGRENRERVLLLRKR